MSTIKELADYVSQLSRNHSDKRYANELREIETMIAQIQLEQTGLIEKRIELMKANEELSKLIDNLNQEIDNFTNTALKPD